MGYIGTFPRNTTAVQGIPINRLRILEIEVAALIAGGGGGFTVLQPTETVDGIRTVFTFATATAQPSYMLIDGLMKPPTTNAGSIIWTWNSGALQATFTTPPQDDLFGIK